MSYILNALRKSEQERQAMQPATVTDRIIAQQPRQNRKTVKWLSAIIVSNILIIGGFLWYAQKNPAPSVTQNPYSSQAVASGQSKHTDKSVTKIIQEPEQKAISTESALTARADREAPIKAPESRMQSITQISKKPKTAPITDAITKGNTSLANKKDMVVVPDRQPLTTMAVSGQTKDQAPIPAPDNRIPFLEELSYEFRQAIPRMKINVFVYSTDPAERFVMINMVKYRVGQQTNDAVKLMEIRSESLVVSYGNQIFQIARP